MNNAICRRCGANTHLPVGATAQESFCSWCGESLAPEHAALEVEAPAPPEPAAWPVEPAAVVPRAVPESPSSSSLSACARCGALVSAVESTTTRGGTVICDACDRGAAPMRSQLCARCGDLMPEGPAGKVGRHSYCSRCTLLVQHGERDLRWESEFRFMGGLTMVIGAIYAIGTVAVGAIALSGAWGGAWGAMGPVEALGLSLVAALSVFIAVVGTSLWRFQNWARIGAGICMALFAGLLLLVVIGGVIGVIIGVILYAIPAVMLLGARGRRITTPEYRDLIAEDPGRARPFSILLMLFLAYIVVMVLMVFAVVLN